uniref:Uncharacterized protein n=1 Tax=Brassica campestris TaxID=3711 RepID=M4D9W3_BRACM
MELRDQKPAALGTGHLHPPESKPATVAVGASTFRKLSRRRRAKKTSTARNLYRRC